MDNPYHAHYERVEALKIRLGELTDPNAIMACAALLAVAETDLHRLRAALARNLENQLRELLGDAR